MKLVTTPKMENKIAGDTKPSCTSVVSTASACEFVRTGKGDSLSSRGQKRPHCLVMQPFRSLCASMKAWALRACGVLVDTVKKMTTLETTARASCDQKLIQLMRLHVTTPRQAHGSGPTGRVDLDKDTLAAHLMALASFSMVPSGSADAARAATCAHRRKVVHCRARRLKLSLPHSWCKAQCIQVRYFPGSVYA